MLRRLKLGTITITPEILGWFGPQCLQSSCHLIFTVTLGLRYYSHDSYHKTYSECLKTKKCLQSDVFSGLWDGDIMGWIQIQDWIKIFLWFISKLSIRNKRALSWIKYIK